MKTATLTFIKSKNDPVFDTPTKISYEEDPHIGEAFLFRYRGLSANVSEVKQITKFDGFSIIRTRNSYYSLTEHK